MKTDYEEARFQRARCYALKNKYDNVIYDCSKVISLNKESVGGYIIRGLTYIEKGLFENAVADLTVAIELNYSNPIVAYTKRALCYDNLKKYEEAVKDYTKVLEIDPNDNNARIFRGRAYAFLNLVKLAIDDLSLALTKEPSNTTALYFWGFVYVLSDDKVKALTDLQKACDLGDKDACTLLQAIQKGGVKESLQRDKSNTVTLGSLEIFNMPSIDKTEAENFTQHLFPLYSFEYEGLIRPQSMLFYSLKYAFPRHCFGHAYLLSTDVDAFVAECNLKGLSNSSDVFKRYVVGHIEIEYGGNLESTTFHYRPMRM